MLEKRIYVYGIKIESEKDMKVLGLHINDIPVQEKMYRYDPTNDMSAEEVDYGTDDEEKPQASEMEIAKPADWPNEHTHRTTKSLHEDPRTRRQIKDMYDDWLHEKHNEYFPEWSLKELKMFYNGDDFWIGKVVCELSTKGIDSPNIYSLIEEECCDKYKGYVNNLLSLKGLEKGEEGLFMFCT